MDQWAPVFAVHFGMPRERLLDLSVPLMVDHVDYLNETRGAGGN